VAQTPVSLTSLSPTSTFQKSAPRVCLQLPNSGASPQVHGIQTQQNADRSGIVADPGRSQDPTGRGIGALGAPPSVRRKCRTPGRGEKGAPRPTLICARGRGS
jgi:hypothetical protein